MRSVTLLLATAGAAALLGALVAGASATRLSSSSQNFRSTFSSFSYSGGFGTVRCPLTLEGSFHSRSIVKAAETLIGYITRYIVGACAMGSATVLSATLPWSVGYLSFSGTLPNITAISTGVAGASVQIREPVFGITCLMASTTGQPERMIFMREGGGALTRIHLGGRIESNCGIPGELEAESNSLTVVNSATRITVTLI